MRAWILFFAATAVLGSACGDDTGSADTPRDFLESAAPLLCDYALRCESPNDLFGSGFFCHPAAAEGLFGELALDEPNMRYDASAARSCLRAIEAGIDGCGVTTDSEVCERVFVGTQSAGQGCDDSDQCAPGLVCVGDSFEEMCAGVCGPAAEIGESCAAVECEAGLGCDETDTCVPLSGEDGPCTSDSDCLNPLLCDAAGQCYPPADAEGRPCEPDDFDPCPPPTDCSAEGVCVRYELGQLAGPGESCVPGECVDLHVCVEGSCEPLPVVDEPCDEVRLCLTGVCVEGTCQAQAGGAACLEDEECASMRCEDDICVARVDLGGSCTFSSDCVAGAECIGDVCAVPMGCD